MSAEKPSCLHFGEKHCFAFVRGLYSPLPSPLSLSSLHPFLGALLSSAWEGGKVDRGEKKNPKRGRRGAASFFQSALSV